MSRSKFSVLIFVTCAIAGCGLSTDGSQEAERYLRGPEGALAGQSIIDAACGELGDGDVECEVTGANGEEGTCEGNVRSGVPDALRCKLK